MRYTTLADLINAYHSGELTPETAKAYIDNDSVIVTLHDPADEDWLEAEDVFSTYPEDVLGQALDLLGIPHEHV